MVLASEYLGISMRITTSIVPVAVYFLVIGLLNSRRHPQLVNGRTDFTMLLAAICPNFAFPLLDQFQMGLPLMAGGVGVFVGAIWLLGSVGSRTLVIYNLSIEEAMCAIESTLGSMGVEFQAGSDSYQLKNCDSEIRLSGFPMLRNVSMRFVGGSYDFVRNFQSQLEYSLNRVEVQTSPMAAGLLLVATAMLSVPMALMAHRVPEIVRLLADFW